MEGRGSFGSSSLSKNTLDLRPKSGSRTPHTHGSHQHHHSHHPNKPAERTHAVERATPAVYLSPQINLKIRRRRARRAATATIIVGMLLVGVVEVSLFWPHHSQTAHLPTPTAAAAALPPAQPAPPPKPSEQEQLQQFVNSFVSNQSGPYAVEIKDLTTGATATTRPNVPILSASLYKLFVAQMVYERIAQGRVELGDYVAGQTVKGCLSDMITWSDNVCGEALGTLVGWGSVNGELHSQGYADTSLTYPQHTSVADVTMLLQRVTDGSFVDAHSSQEMFALLSQQKVNNRLPAGLPGVKIAHKTGDLYSFEHDAGIVDGPKGKYIISVMTGPWPDLAPAAPSIAQFSKETYQFFESH